MGHTFPRSSCKEPHPEEGRLRLRQLRADLLLLYVLEERRRRGEPLTITSTVADCAKVGMSKATFSTAQDMLADQGILRYDAGWHTNPDGSQQKVMGIWPEGESWAKAVHAKAATFANGGGAP